MNLFLVRGSLLVCLHIPFVSPILTSRIVRVSRDGRDLVILLGDYHVVFIRDFERICRGEITFERAGLILNIQTKDRCYCLDFEHGRVCVATVRISQSHLVIVRVHVLFADSRDLYFHHRP